MGEVNSWFGIDENKKIIKIYDLEKGQLKKENKKVYCPICNGILRANQGDIKTWYFSHENADDCNSESLCHWSVKYGVIEKGDKFKVKLGDDIKEFECENIEIEKSYDTKYGTYKPDLTITTAKGEIIFFEFANTNKKRIKDYIDIWKTINNIVVEIKIKDIIDGNKLEVVNAIYYEGKEYYEKYRDMYNYLDRETMKKEYDKIQIEKVKWLLDDILKYNLGKIDIDIISDEIQAIEDKEVRKIVVNILSKKCRNIMDNYIEYNKKEIERLFKLKNFNIKILNNHSNYDRIYSKYKIEYEFINSKKETYFIELNEKENCCEDIVNKILDRKRIISIYNHFKNNEVRIYINSDEKEYITIDYIRIDNTKNLSLEDIIKKYNDKLIKKQEREKHNKEKEQESIFKIEQFCKSNNFICNKNKIGYYDIYKDKYILYKNIKPKSDYNKLDYILESIINKYKNEQNILKECKLYIKNIVNNDLILNNIKFGKYENLKCYHINNKIICGENIEEIKENIDKCIDDIIEKEKEKIYKKENEEKIDCYVINNLFKSNNIKLKLKYLRDYKVEVYTFNDNYLFDYLISKKFLFNNSKEKVVEHIFNLFKSKNNKLIEILNCNYIDKIINVYNNIGIYKTNDKYNWYCNYEVNKKIDNIKLFLKESYYDEEYNYYVKIYEDHIEDIDNNYIKYKNYNDLYDTIINLFSCYTRKIKYGDGN